MNASCERFTLTNPNGLRVSSSSHVRFVNDSEIIVQKWFSGTVDRPSG
jgi:hypothetical protein